MLDLLPQSTCVLHHFLTEKKQKWRSLFINNTKLKEYKSFDHGRVKCCTTLLKSARGACSFIRSISHNWDETELYINGGKIYWLILLEFNSIFPCCFLPLGGMIIWLEAERTRQDKLKDNTRRKGGVRFFVLFCLFYFFIVYFSQRKKCGCWNKSTELKIPCLSNIKLLPLSGLLNSMVHHP